MESIAKLAAFDILVKWSLQVLSKMTKNIAFEIKSIKAWLIVITIIYNDWYYHDHQS